MYPLDKEHNTIDNRETTVFGGFVENSRHHLFPAREIRDEKEEEEETNPRTTAQARICRWRERIFSRGGGRFRWLTGVWKLDGVDLDNLICESSRRLRSMCDTAFRVFGFACLRRTRRTFLTNKQQAAKATKQKLQTTLTLTLYYYPKSNSTMVKCA